MRERTQLKVVSIDLTNISEADLLKGVVNILTTDGPVTTEQREELDAINSEFARREALKLNAA